ncbi:MAG TPA: type II toxin-antitoxin system RelE/ParE family toxin [Planctomycetes bacterium]|nr:type II toxin-antitoxin system RelE/ParE family toxin [Planctomycetota bacterium]
MAVSLTWAPTARQDFRQLLSYIAEANPAAARMFGRKLLETVGQLREFPQSGRVVPEFGDANLREVIRKPCRIVYRLSNRGQVVEIVRIWHAARGTPEP